jgi:hypothetical protein
MSRFFVPTLAPEIVVPVVVPKVLVDARELILMLVGKLVEDFVDALFDGRLDTWPAAFVDFRAPDK